MEIHFQLLFERMGDIGGILNEGVQAVDIKRRTRCEGGLLEHN